MRSVIFRLSALAALGALVVSVAAGCSDDDDEPAAGSVAPELTDPQETGRELATEFLTILQSGDTDELAEFLADAFQLQRADGSGVTKSEYVANPAQIDSFELGDDVVAVQQGSVLTVRWSLRVSEVIDGEAFAEAEAPRLSTFVYVDGRWRLLAHANFNVPAERG